MNWLTGLTTDTPDNEFHYLSSNHPLILKKPKSKTLLKFNCPWKNNIVFHVYMRM